MQEGDFGAQTFTVTLHTTGRQNIQVNAFFSTATGMTDVDVQDGPGSEKGGQQAQANSRSLRSLGLR